VPENLLESELFGYMKGAFTGASHDKKGLFEEADGGTIFLDEVGETSPNMQVRLLRVLETGEVLRVGGGAPIKVDVRVVAATNRNLGDAVRSGAFRQDLYYRLKGVNLYLPPLRERKEDIPILVQRFVAQANRAHQKSVRGVEPDAMRRVVEHSWPGNIRELKNLVETLVVLTPGPRITRALVDAHLVDRSPGGGSPLLPVALGKSREEAEREMMYASLLALHRDVREILRVLKEGGVRSVAEAGAFEGLREVRPDQPATPPSLSLEHIERTAIREALNRSGGNRRRAADSLGISERTLYRKIKEYGLG
jgi:transcriptional regulator with PAS, ATPase and Fis domain